MTKKIQVLLKWVEKEQEDFKLGGRITQQIEKDVKLAIIEEVITLEHTALYSSHLSGFIILLNLSKWDSICKMERVLSPLLGLFWKYMIYMQISRTVTQICKWFLSY